MMFLIRTAFWLSVVFSLLPTDFVPPNVVKTTDAISAAGAAMVDLQSFCVRQKEACVVGQQVIENFGGKAGAGAKFVADQLADQLSEATRKAEGRPARSESESRQNRANERIDDSLNGIDRLIPFHPPAPRNSNHPA